MESPITLTQGSPRQRLLAVEMRARTLPMTHVSYLTFLGPRDRARR